MSWLITIIIGAIIGWIASAIMRTRQGLLLDIVVGIAGSIIGVWFFSDVLGIGPVVMPGTISLLSIIWGIIGAVVLIAIIEALIPGAREGMSKSEVYHEYDERGRRRKK